MTYWPLRNFETIIMNKHIVNNCRTISNLWAPPPREWYPWRRTRPSSRSPPTAACSPESVSERSEESTQVIEHWTKQIIRGIPRNNRFISETRHSWRYKPCESFEVVLCTPVRNYFHRSTSAVGAVHPLFQSLHPATQINSLQKLQKTHPPFKKIFSI